MYNFLADLFNIAVCMCVVRAASRVVRSFLDIQAAVHSVFHAQVFIVEENIYIVCAASCPVVR